MWFDPLLQTHSILLEKFADPCFLLLIELLAHKDPKLQTNASLALQLVCERVNKTSVGKEIFIELVVKHGEVIPGLLKYGLSVQKAERTAGVDDTTFTQLVLPRLCTSLESLTHALRVDNEVVATTMRTSDLIPRLCQLYACSFFYLFYYYYYSHPNITQISPSMTNDFTKANANPEVTVHLLALFRVCLAQRSFSKVSLISHDSLLVDAGFPHSFGWCRMRDFSWSSFFSL